MYALEIIHDRLVPALLKILDTDAPEGLWPDDRRLKALTLLGKLRTREAIPILVRRIDSPRVIAHELPPFGWYPYASTLTGYGDAATSSILAYLTAVRDVGISDTAIDLYAHTLMSGAGKPERFRDRANAAIGIIEREITNTPAARQQDLQRLLARLHEMAENPARAMIPRR
jgi:hypothetical protein